MIGSGEHGSEIAIEIRDEVAGDETAIDRVNRVAFDGPGEADLVTTLRDSDVHCVSLVATAGGEIVGHVLFTPVHVEDAPLTLRAMALGPMAVLPAWQRRGVGTRLAAAGIERCGERGDDLVFVLGHPTYYPRFGFEPAATHDLFFRNASFAPAFFVSELRSGALADARGEVRYHAAFDKV